MSQNRLSRKKRTVYGPANQEDRIRNRRGIVRQSDAFEGGAGQRRVPSSELTIARLYNEQTPEAQDGWQPLLDDLAARNRRKGKTVAVGTIACEFAGPEVMGQMLAKKFPSAWSDAKKRLRIQRSFADNFNNFVRQQDKANLDMLFERGTGVRLEPNPLITNGDDIVLPIRDFDYEPHADTGLLLFDESEIIFESGGDRMWNEGLFAVGAIDKSGPHTVAVNLDQNEQLHREFSEIRGFMKEDKLDTNLLRGDFGRFIFRPHADIFETFDEAGVAILTFNLDIPGALPLHAPKAVVNQ